MARHRIACWHPGSCQASDAAAGAPGSPQQAAQEGGGLYQPETLPPLHGGAAGCAAGSDCLPVSSGHQICRQGLRDPRRQHRRAEGDLILGLAAGLPVKVLLLRNLGQTDRLRHAPGIRATHTGSRIDGAGAVRDPDRLPAAIVSNRNRIQNHNRRFCRIIAKTPVILFMSDTVAGHRIAPGRADHLRNPRLASGRFSGVVLN